MQSKLLNITFISVFIISFTKALNEKTFENIFSLVQIPNQNVSSTFEKKEKEVYLFECVEKKFKRRLIKESEIVFDAGFDGCGWEIGALHMSCSQNTISNLWAETRRVANPFIKKITTLISTEPTTKVIKIPVGNYITRIIVGYTFSENTQFVTKISVKSDDGKEQIISCGNPEISVTSEVDRNQRMDGLRMVLDDKARITAIDFHSHEIVYIGKGMKGKKEFNSMSYLNFFETKLLKLDRLEDNFFLRGPAGFQIGRYFIDDKYYNDWQLSDVIIESDNVGIKSIQLQLNHTLFTKTIRTRIRGNKKRDPTLTKILSIPVNQHISLAKFFMSNKKKLTGIKFKIYNGRESDCFGVCPDFKLASDYARLVKTVYFSNKDNIIGLFGYQSQDYVESIGFLLNIKLGTEGSNFILQST